MNIFYAYYLSEEMKTIGILASIPFLYRSATETLISPRQPDTDPIPSGHNDVSFRVSRFDVSASRELNFVLRKKILVVKHLSKDRPSFSI